MKDNVMHLLMGSILKRMGFNENKALLKFSTKNQKLGNMISLSLPAGHSCPFAKDCRSCATRKDSTPKGFGIQDGKDTKFRCFAAIDEVLRPVVRLARWHNYLLLLWTVKRGVDKTATLIEKSLPKDNGKPTRIHVSGDFFKEIYFLAWMKIAMNHPHRIFYAYTKALPFWVKHKNSIPSNLRLVASYGGTHDHLITKNNLRYAVVVKSVEEAKRLNLPIDHDDSYAYTGEKSFALLVHGQQPAGTPFAKAWSTLKKMGMGGYGKTINKTRLAGKK